MIRCEQRPLERPSRGTGSSHGWTVVMEDGRRIPWIGLQTGPLTLDAAAVEASCQALLGFGTDVLARHCERVLQPATGAKADRPALILHSTTPELKTFDGDLDALVRGRPGGDFTTYKEARSVYLAGPEDIVVGRTRAWQAAVAEIGAKSIRLEDVDHYYLSHALLHTARGEETEAMRQMIASVRETARVIRLYAFEPEMQIFLLWLARMAGRDELAVEANRPTLAAAWNRKSVLHPTVTRAAAMDASRLAEAPAARLAQESRNSVLAEQLDLDLDLASLPGYTIERDQRSVEDFVDQLLVAARLLHERYGLVSGCLKASESGDGARITPGIKLDDHGRLTTLGREAHVYGDDYVLEAHVTYGQALVAGQMLPTALSAHVRGGRLAPGATVQFVEGTSWKGNVLLDEAGLDAFGISPDHYRRLRGLVEDFLVACNAQTPGLVLAGIDVAIGTVGGTFGSTPILGVQDLNISFTGAECLRALLAKARRAKTGDDGHRCGVTRIYKPSARGDHAAFRRVTRSFARGPIYADTVASIPERWAMVGITGADPADALSNLSRLEEALKAAGLVETSS